ncbi:MAG: cobyrinate a,c-diamide synthase [Deltaproteobacteria bacterium]|nr:cobyrinate a,c-diamide synthase [Deltaproteobacteria bacterium]MBW2050967.1 cobyrinate a,c-diamide synthase [Deltaproteobacteria bacterium]MBW2139638.1 cobyrinate a,c-diamide synthase [Deltaproteobacteria bacterium]MBW2322250.1 cobyrinate a,c-diamide synthase [Deltaproteobacteria bacterium]
MNLPCPRLVVAALRGGGGKTTISLGLLAAWRKNGRNLIPFKKGPDYIDAGWLASAAQSPCYNLDTYLMTPEKVIQSFACRLGRESDGALIEGNRGLYDGTDKDGTNSTAELAKLLNAPVILVVDCTKATRTLAAVVLGCLHFDTKVRLGGVILNKVATARQEALVRSTIETETGLSILGAVPRARGQNLPERHLGLVPRQEHPAGKGEIEKLAELAENHLDLDGLWNLAKSAPELEYKKGVWFEEIAESVKQVKIGVIRDSAFQFYYPENLEALERLGAKLVTFSALSVKTIPDVDALYLGGGFPETHAEILASNEKLRQEFYQAAMNGLPIYAECGGLMYLGRELIVRDRTYPMAGVFPVTFGIESRPQGHGYTILEAVKPNPYYPVGEELVGHEFHYSRPLNYEADKVDLVLKVRRGYGFDQGRDGLVVRNVLGTYTHLHALGNVRWAEALVDLAAGYRGSENNWRREAADES